jgi:hypothetical protein
LIDSGTVHPFKYNLVQSGPFFWPVNFIIFAILDLDSELYQFGYLSHTSYVESQHIFGHRRSVRSTFFIACNVHVYTVCFGDGLPPLQRFWDFRQFSYKLYHFDFGVTSLHHIHNDADMWIFKVWQVILQIEEVVNNVGGGVQYLQKLIAAPRKFIVQFIVV